MNGSIDCLWQSHLSLFRDRNFKLALPLAMIPPRVSRKSRLYLRTAMVVFAIIFGGVIFCGSKSNNHTSTAFNYGGVEQIEFHQALPGRLLFYQVSSFCAPAALTISPSLDLLSPKSFGPATTFATIRPYHVFSRTITINAP